MGKDHTPIRTCVVCGQKKTKSTLLRMALDCREKGPIVLDLQQVREGRGAYVCPGCLPRLRFTRRVQKAFRNRANGLADEIFMREQLITKR